MDLLKRMGNPPKILGFENGLGLAALTRNFFSTKYLPGYQCYYDPLMNLDQIKSIILKNDGKKLIILHEDCFCKADLDELKWLTSAWIISYSKNRFDWCSAYNAACTLYSGSFIMHEDGETLQEITPKPSNTTDEQVKQMLSQGSTFRLDLTKSELEARAAVQLPHFAAQRGGTEALPSYDPVDEESDPDE